MKKELSEVEKKRLLKKNHHQKIDYALAKAFVNDADVYKLVKDFFAEYLDLRYEFTHEELTQELNKKFIDETLKKQIVNYLARLSFMQYNTDQHPSQDQLKDMIREFKDIISKLIVFEEQKKTGLVDKIKALLSLKKEKKEKKEEVPVQEETSEAQEAREVHDAVPEISVVQNGKDKPESVQMLIQQVEQYLRMNNVMEAKAKYKQLIGLYNTLPEPEKPKYFQKVNDLYTLLSR